MKNWLFLGACGALVAAQACGNSNGSSSGTNSTGTSSGSSTSTGTSTGSSTSTGTSSGSSTSTGTSTGSSSSTGTSSGSSSSGSGAGGGAPCAHEIGAYSIVQSGTGCGTLDGSAQQCINATPTKCTLALVSQQGVNNTGVDGTVALDLAGDFTGASLTFGSTAETGCSGTWDATTSQLAVTCGTCTATLSRTSTTCGF
jgi:hypothetical protein